MEKINFAIAMIFLPFLLFIGQAIGQGKLFEAFDWRPMKAPKLTSLHPYRDDTTTTSYDSRYFHTNPEPYHGSSGYYQDSSRPYETDPGHYPVDSYSSSYSKSAPYQYPDNSASYAEQEGYGKNEKFNITIERYGGFGGTGDTRGFGAYDYPKKVHEVPQDLYENDHKVDTDFPDILRLGRSRSIFHRRNSMHVHPLPPPL